MINKQIMQQFFEAFDFFEDYILSRQIKQEFKKI